MFRLDVLNTGQLSSEKPAACLLEFQGKKGGERGEGGGGRGKGGGRGVIGPVAQGMPGAWRQLQH